ncbi:valine--tRNA ligase, partial [Rhodobacteraceae bacterium]|nr:valine--tRNA ligase [Paracoccaceae bacterium]
TRSIRGLMNVPKKTMAPLLKVSLDAAGKAAWAANETIILRDREAGISGLQDVEEAPKGAAAIAVDGGTFALPLEGLIDVATEKARLEKTVGKLQKDLGGLQGRLKNPKFRENASAEVIEETEDTARQKTEELKRLQSALDRLAELS